MLCYWFVFISNHNYHKCITAEPLYNEVLGTMKITLLYQVSRYIRVNTKTNIKSWDQQNDVVIKRVLLYPTSFITRFHCNSFTT